MAIQIRGNQIKNETVEAAKINLSGSFDFRAASSFIAATKAEADNSTAVATTAYVHTMVSGSVADNFAGGDGISITDGEGTDTIAVDLATNPGLQFTSNKLDLKVKSETGGSITKDGDGIYIGDNAIGNAKLAGSIANSKLANSTISGVALGSNLASLSAGNGISMSSYNGSTAVNNLTLNLDGSTLSVGASGLKIADGGVDGGQLANLAVATAKIADSAVSSAKIADGAVATSKIANDAVDASKLGVASTVDSLTANGSTTAFDLSSTIDDAFAQILVFRNGICVEQVESSPSGVDQFSLSLDGGAGGVARITFGSAPAAGDDLRAFYIA